MIWRWGISPRRRGSVLSLDLKSRRAIDDAAEPVSAPVSQRRDLFTWIACFGAIAIDVLPIIVVGTAFESMTVGTAFAGGGQGGPNNVGGGNTAAAAEMRISLVPTPMLGVGLAVLLEHLGRRTAALARQWARQRRRRRRLLQHGSP